MVKPSVLGLGMASGVYHSTIGISFEAQEFSVVTHWRGFINIFSRLPWLPTPTATIGPIFAVCE